MNDLKTTFMNVCNQCVHERPKKAYSLTECKPRGKKLMFMNDLKTMFMNVRNFCVHEQSKKAYSLTEGFQRGIRYENFAFPKYSPFAKW